MLLPNEALFDYVLIDLAEEVTSRPAPPVNPLPCDRYVARSCLQKAIRRAEPVLAQRALANLYLHDRRSAWRALTIIALEDVGVTNVDVLAQIVAAQGKRTWRTQMGGDWPVLASLARQMAESLHCQAACDLLLHATNNPSHDEVRATALELSADGLAQQLWDRNVPPIQRGLAVLALGGELADGQRYRDPAAVFDILSEAGRSSHVVATCRAAWKISRNPMALLLPLVWDEWMMNEQDHVVADDLLPPVQMLADVPGYSLDQFTRIGNNVSRALLKECPDIGRLLNELGVSAGHSRAVGDLLFIAEGGLLKRRMLWSVGNGLRQPTRMLPTIAVLGNKTEEAVVELASQARHIKLLRQQHFYRGGA